MPRRLSARLFLSLAGICLRPPLAAAQVPAVPSSESAVAPPALLQAQDALYPEEARSSGVEATVVLRLLVDAEGAVQEAEVVAPAGRGFDEAAREAALRFRFEPARRGAAPVAARILYRYEFKLPQALAPDPPRASDVAGPTSTASGAASTAPGTEQATPSNAPSSPVEVTVVGSLNEGQRLQQSAEAVSVLDTRKAKQRAADMGQVLTRTQGIVVRRSGGLGTDTRVSMNGLYDQQIRFFIDGVPLELAGYPLDVASVPVNLVERVEVYRGVVPIRFGADALGGAINLVTNQVYETQLGASYQVGSFGTHRVSASGRYRHEPSSLVFGFAAFFDVTQNNYDVDVRVPGRDGRQVTATVPRFHDAYRAYGANVELGVVDQRWARRLVLKGFQTGFEKEIQNNNVMEVVYGEVTSSETIRGLTGQYDLDFSPNVDLKLVASYAHRAIEYTDKSRWVYNWFGRRVRERRSSAEANDEPEDNRTWEHGVFARALLSWTIRPGHVLRAVATPKFATRTGDELIQPTPDAFDPLIARNYLFTVVSGLEYETSWFEERLANVLFVKGYVYESRASEPVPENERFRDMDMSIRRPGFGDSLRYRFTPWLLAKASYEFATRLPEPDEVFGDAQQSNPNLDLQPELSHNANAGPRLDLKHPRLGLLTLDVNAFLRETDQQIILLGGERHSFHENVYSARSYGVECGVFWSPLRRAVSLEGTFTWQDLRNTSSAGSFAAFQGDPIPNRSNLFGSWGASLRVPGVSGARDKVELFYGGRYVHGFFRSWESAGVRSSKQTIPSQTTHNAGVTWSVESSLQRVAATFEVDNFTDAKVYDEFGIQRPGRAFYVKVTGEL